MQIISKSFLSEEKPQKKSRKTLPFHDENLSPGYKEAEVNKVQLQFEFDLLLPFAKFFKFYIQGRMQDF